MKEDDSIRPPRWAEKFLAWYCRPDLLEDLQGDLEEYFSRNISTQGPTRARFIYVLDVLKFFRLYTVRKPHISLPSLRLHMIGSYLKTSGRTIRHNKLFSGLNIAGLAISMSVGLLVISFVSDLYSYDSFHKNKERIFRVVSEDQRLGETGMKLATSSLKAGELIRQEVPGIESFTYLRAGTATDARVGETVLPISSMRASESFFKIFSFPLLKGNAAVALKEPQSIILTQKTVSKLFGHGDPMGKMVKIDTLNYLVTGVAENVPKLSHMDFDAIISFTPGEWQKKNDDGDLMNWENIYSNYDYLLLPENANRKAIQANLDRLSEKENKLIKNRKISLSLQPLKEIAVGKPLANEIGPSIHIAAVWILSGLALVVILSACFNYTNLSIARSLKRSREVGIRKVIGALRSQVLGQFIAESIIVSLLALGISFVLFLFLRKEFLSFHPFLSSLVSLELSPKLFYYFFILSMVVGLIAGLLPAIFYSRINAIRVLKDISTIKVFRHINLRKALIVVQYTFSLIFITATMIGYSQYKGFLHFDLGFSTSHILNIKMQGNKEDVFIKELSAIPSIKSISKSQIISSLGSIYGSSLKYKDPLDSADVDMNFIDEHYLPLHKYAFLAGRNFGSRPDGAVETETVVNKELLRRFNIGKNDPGKAIGETVLIDGKKLVIIGVLQDFHYGTLDRKIHPTILRYSNNESNGYLNLQMAGSNTRESMTAIETAWHKVDPVHALDAKFYDDQIEEAYSQFSVMIKVIGFFSFLAICIASLGLFGMVIYSTERRMKEISIRKVLGASERFLIYLLSKGFLTLLIFSAMIAIPLTWVFFSKVLLVNFAYHQPIGLGSIFIGFLIVAAIAFLMICTYAMKAARSNPATVLKAE